MSKISQFERDAKKKQAHKSKFERYKCIRQHNQHLIEDVEINK